MIVCQYLTFASGLRTASPDEVREYRRIARQQATEWQLIRPDEAPPLRIDGVDPDIARIAGFKLMVH